MAAVIACGSTAVLSHGQAAALHGLRPSGSGPINVTAPGRSRREIAKVRSHGVRRLHDADVTMVDGIPSTTVARTLLDLAETVRPQQLRLGLEAAERLELFDLRDINAAIERNPGRHGIKPLTEALTDLTGPAPWTQSELERQFLALIREHGLPEPQANVVVAGLTVDFYWPAQRLVVEVDGYAFHRTRAQFEADHRRDATLQVNDLRVIRPTQRRIAHDGDALVGELERLLADGGPGLSADGPAGR
jgi:very-short-patch-repair endonuclease